jgi:hypothetical protein
MLLCRVFGEYEHVLRLIKFSRASIRVKCLKVDKTDVSRTISVLVLSRRESLKSYMCLDTCFSMLARY